MLGKTVSHKQQARAVNLRIRDDVRSLIHQGAGEQDLRLAARRAGMVSMREDGERWVRSGVTAPEEILRVTRDA